MNKKNAPFLYILGIFLPIFGLFMILGPIGYILYNLITNHSVSMIPTIISCIVAGVGVILMLFSSPLRQDARQEMETDQYGIRKKQYKSMSKEERMILDMETAAQNELALSDAEYRGMCKKGSKDPDGDLERMIGIPDIKKEVLALKAQWQFKGENKRLVNLCFLGEPGTGKTSVVSIITGYLYRYRYIKYNQYVIVNGASLVTSSDPIRRITLLLAKSKNKVLFIDEAYALAGSAYGPQILAIILSDIEDNRNHMEFIIAGYKSEMKRLFAMNPGLESRIDRFMFFENYDANEIKDIIKLMAKSRGYKFSKQALDKSVAVCVQLAHAGLYANARTARNICEDSIKNRQLRYIQYHETDKPYLISEKDVEFQDKKAAYFTDGVN